MRPRIHAAGLPLLWIALGSGLATSPAPGADGEALATLKEQGLAKSGRTFLIEAEQPVLAKIKEVRATLAGYANLLDRQAAVEQAAAQLAHLDAQRAELQENLTDFNQRIVEQSATQGNAMGRPGQRGFVNPMIAQRDQIKATLEQVKMEQQALKARAPQVKERSAMESDVKAKGDAANADLAEVRPMIDAVRKTYADLGADKSVKAAIAELERASKATLKLGPSDAFLAGVKAIDQAEQRLFGKKATPASRKKAKPKK